MPFVFDLPNKQSDSAVITRNNKPMQFSKFVFILLKSVCVCVLERHAFARISRNLVENMREIVDGLEFGSVNWVWIGNGDRLRNLPISASSNHSKQ